MRGDSMGKAPRFGNIVFAAIPVRRAVAQAEKAYLGSHFSQFFA